jgi:hypothetical protein
VRRARSPYRFDQRAELYAEWDQQLCAKTRFFAAASVTNRVLGALTRMAFPLRLSLGAGELLERLGASLERRNRCFAERLSTEERSGALLDTWMVQSEQQRVEGFLKEWAVIWPAHMRRVTAELDEILNWDFPCSLWNALLPSVSGYFSVLRLARHEVGAPIEFAQQAHRVRIGQVLIEAIRGEEIALPGAFHMSHSGCHAQKLATLQLFV